MLAPPHRRACACATAPTCIEQCQAAATHRCHGAAPIALCDGALQAYGVWEILLHAARSCSGAQQGGRELMQHARCLASSMASSSWHGLKVLHRLCQVSTQVLSALPASPSTMAQLAGAVQPGRHSLATSLARLRQPSRRAARGLTPEGMVGASARWARVPCPTSRLEAPPTRPVSPTQLGGK